MSSDVALKFCCVECNEEYVSFFLSESSLSKVSCKHCGASYCLDEETNGQVLRNFRNLCKQILISKDILGEMSVGISVGESAVEIPFNLLLTRFPLRLTFILEGKKLSVECIFDALRQEVLAKEVSCSMVDCSVC